MPLPLVGAELALKNQDGYIRDAGKIQKKTGLITKALGGMATAGVHGGSAVTGALTAVMGPVGVLVKGVGGLAKSFIGLAASGGSLKGIQIVFDNLTQSYGLNADILERLRTATKGAVDDFELMKQTNKALVGAGKEFGKEFGERLPLLMAVSREAAKAQGQSVEYMFDSIVTGIKRSSPMILDNLGFQFSLSEANEKYAASIGKTTKELSKEEKQIALLNAVTSASADLIAATGGSVDTAAKQALSWRTELVNLKKYMAVELEPILISVMGLIGKPGVGAKSIAGSILMATRVIVQKIVPAIDAFGASLHGFIGGPLATFISSMKAIGIGGFEDIASSFAAIFTSAEMPSFRLLEINLKNALSPILGPKMAKEISKNLTTAFTDVATIVQTVRGPIESVISIFKTLIEYMLFTAGSTDWLNDSLADLPEGLRPVVTEVGKLISGVSAEVSKLAGGDLSLFESIIPEGFQDVISQIPGFFDKVKVSIKSVGDELGNVDWDVVFQGLMDVIAKVLPLWLKFQGMFSPFGLVMEATKRKGTGLFKNLYNSITPLVKNLGKIFVKFGVLLFDIFTKVFPVLVDIIDVAFEAIMQAVFILVEDVIPLLVDALNVVVGWVVENWPRISAIITETLMVVLEVVRNVLGELVPFIIEQIQGIVDWLKEIWPDIEETITTVLNAIVTGTEVYMALLKKLWERYGGIISRIVGKLWGGIKDNVVTVITIIKEIIEGVMALIRGDWEEVWESIKTIGEEVFEAIIRNISQAVDILFDLLELGWNLIKDTVMDVWNSINIFLAENWAGILAKANEIFWGLVDALVGEGGVFPSIVSKGEELWDGFKEWLVGEDGLFQSIKTKVVEIWNSIKDILVGPNGIITGIKNSISTIFDDIKEVIYLGVQAAKNIIENIRGDLEDAWSSLWSGLAGILRVVWNGVIDELVIGVNSAIDVFNDLIDAANIIPGVSIPKIGKLDPGRYYLADGGILSKPMFVAGESGPEVVSPLSGLVESMTSSMVTALQTFSNRQLSLGPQMPVQSVVNNTSYVDGRQYNLETQSMTRPGYLELEFAGMEMASL